MSKSIIGLVLSIAVLAILLTGCSDEPDPNPSNEIDSSTTSSEQPGGTNILSNRARTIRLTLHARALR